jgi:ELWxxDGT repeat protein
MLDSLSLCRSDGTAAGTWRVCAPANYTVGNLAYNWYSLPCAAGSNLYFVANDWTNGFELWKTDGSHAGTMLVKDINSTGASAPRHLIEMNGVLYFSADDGINGRELWKSDGTAQGTVMVADINPGSAASNPCYITLVGNALYFTAAGESNTRQLWKSDGTQAGTLLVATINPAGDCDLGTPYENPCYVKSRFAVANGNFYFRATDGVHGMELWESDGTSAGTRMLADIYSGPEGSMPRGVIELSGKILFTADHPSWGSEPWVFDPAQPVSPKQIEVIGGSSSTEPRILPLYPNPVSLSTYSSTTPCVSLDLPGECHARLCLNDFLGREIALVHDGTLRAGMHTLNLDPGLLAPGVYVLQLQAGGSHVSRTFAVVR